MELSKLSGKALTFAKVLYAIIAICIFGPIALYWCLGVIFTPLFIYGLFSESSLEPLIPISLVTFGGFSLICFAILNHQILNNKIRLYEIKTIHIAATIIGCLMCIIAAYFVKTIVLTPIALVITLYYFGYTNNRIDMGASPTSQNHPPQEQT
ncbi:hypothetical protein GCM10023151_03180 [Kangiella marina]|uniref:Uncharacterized protein n=1 Tax=Kangiella marina TaxID=1079178 RepID=A0ABP8IC57_9GAMM